MKDKINAKIKFREKYRPFAPAVLWDYVQKLDNSAKKMPYMTIAITPSLELSKEIPETIHGDGTARLQTIETGHPFYNLLSELANQGHFPGIINTSFNLSGEPIVNSPADAIRTFYSCGMDELYMNNIVIKKTK